jgi:hypothetical protein
MEHPYILPHIEQRMQEMGFKKFHFETVIVKSLGFFAGAGGYNINYVTGEISKNRYGQRVAEIDASNQFYYLVQKVVSSDLKIISDTDCLTKDEVLKYSTYTFHNFKEFTGQIFITDSAGFELEFIRATPYE